MAMRVRSLAHPERTPRSAWRPAAAVGAIVLTLVLGADAAA
jgi:hypothetical protein